MYQFGQRRVAIKVEKGDNVLVRVGGGYMDVQEFINNFTESEVEKIERNNVISRFEHKIAAQKIAHQRSVSHNEIKPINMTATRHIKRSVSRIRNQSSLKRNTSSISQIKFSNLNRSAG